MPWDEYTYANLTGGGFFKAFEYGNDLTYDLFGVGTLFGFFAILFISFRQYGNDKAFAAASFMTFIMSVIMRSGELVGDMYVVLFAVATMISIVTMRRQ